MRNFTIFKTGSQRGVNTFMSGEGAIEHPMSTRSASDGTSWAARGWRYIASILMILMLCVGNAWAIDWKQYDSKLISGQKYLMYSENTKGSYSTNHFLRHPTVEWGATDPATSKTVTGSNFVKYFVTTAHAEATWFTLESTGAVSTYTIKYKKNYNDAGESWKYITHQWGKTSGINNTWNTTSTDIWVLDGYTKSGTTYPNGLKYNDYATPTAGVANTNDKFFYIQTVSGPTSKLGNAGGSTPLNFLTWTFICEEAYEDATGTQYYYTVGTQVYVNGVADATGGELGVLKPTYKKPAYTDWTASDYETSIAKKQQGSSSSSAIVTIYAKVLANEGKNFEGFSNGSGVALTEQEAVAANTYYEVDAENHIYRVSFAANGTDASPMAFTLRANFTQSVSAVANVYDTNDEATGYATFGAALAAAQNGYRLELLADVENLTSTITIDKGITLDFNGCKIKSAATGAPTNLIEITAGNVTFADSQTTPGGVTTTGATAVLVSGGSLTVNDGKYVGATYAVQRTSGSVTIKSGGFTGNTQDVNGTIALNGGYFVHDAGLNVGETYAVSPYIPLGMKYSAGYSYMVISKSSPNYPVCTVLNKEKVTVGDTYHYTILSSINFSTLEAAIAYANNNPNTEIEYKDIMMREDYTLPAGNYTIPVQTTLVIPYCAAQTQACPEIDRIETDAIPTSAYRTLTLANGVHIDVFGAIEAGGVQTAGTQNATTISRPGVSADGGTYGLMLMNGSSSITLYNDAFLYAWGFVQGTGTIDVRRGASVKEQFQINDWKTITPTCFMAQGTGSGGSPNYQLHVLPVNQYFIQNVEVKTTYRPGSHLFGQVCANVVGLNVAFNDVGIIGVRYSQTAHDADPTLKDDVAIFLMDDDDDSEDTWVCKSYDVAHDVQLYEVNNAAYLGSLSMKVDFTSNPTITTILATLGFSGVTGLDVDSKDFVLALSNNFKIHLKSGNLTVTQNTVMLPGMVMEINKKSTLTIAPRVWDDDHQTWINTPQTLSLYDYKQWDTYAANGVVGEMQWAYATHIKYRPNGTPDNSVRDISSPAAIGNAQLIVHGTVDIQGYLKTTNGDKEASADVEGQKIKTFTQSDCDPQTVGGASIISTIEDAGTIVYTRAAQAENNDGPFVYNDFLWQTVFTVLSQEPDYEGKHLIPALLRNGDNSLVHSQNTEAGKSFCFIDMDNNGVGEWTCLTDAGCFVYDQNNIYYIKPQAYVPISVGAPVAEPDHTYRDHYAGTNKIYIQLDDCQWWEVVETATPGIFHCEHPLNDTYFYWNGTKWAEKRFNVTFKTYDGFTLTYTDKNGVEQDHYELTYGTTPNWLGDIPQRSPDNSYTYTFAGWTPTPYAVDKDEVYTAKYTTTPRMYLIRFEDQAHNLIENQYLTWGEQPECASHTLTAKEQWEPAVGVVAGDATYTLATKKTDDFTIRFVNYNGSVLLTLTEVESGSTPVYTGSTPSKQAIDDETYTFAGWQAVSGDIYTTTLPAAMEDATYTATFNAAKKTYAIRFYQENGTTQIGSTQEVEYGAMPTVPKYSRDATDAQTFTLVWSPLVTAASQAQDYTATFTPTTRQYEVVWKNYDGSTITTDHVDYGTTPVYSGLTPTKEDATKIYTFTGWGSITAVTGNQSYTAQFDEGHLKTVEVAVNGTNDFSGHVETLILNGSEEASGQLTGDITATNAFYDLQLNTEGRHWHAFGVPWQVNLDADPLKEIKTKDGVECDHTLVLGRDYEIVYYNGAKRASQGAGAHCWELVAKGAHILQPGQGYMIAFAGDAGTLRFAKKAFTPVIFSGTMSVDANDGGAADDNGWNAIANPKAFHVTMNAGPTVGYVHDGGEIGSDGYTTYDIDDKKFVVGKMVYVQVTASQSVVINPAGDKGVITPAAAPARRTRVTDKQYLSLRDYYQIGIADANAQGGRVYVLPEEDKADEYVIGHDLSHLGISDQKAQIWVYRYGANLALNTTAPIEGVADYTLRIYAPKNGEYTISNIQSPLADEDYTVYLTRDGEAIWNLSDGAYMIDLTAGVHKQYGLRLSAKAPQIATGIDEAIVDAKGEIRKVLIDNNVYIIRGEQVYSVDGQLVK